MKGVIAPVVSSFTLPLWLLPLMKKLQLYFSALEFLLPSFPWILKILSGHDLVELEAFDFVHVDWKFLGLFLTLNFQVFVWKIWKRKYRPVLWNLDCNSTSKILNPCFFSIISKGNSMIQIFFSSKDFWALKHWVFINKMNLKSFWFVIGGLVLFPTSKASLKICQLLFKNLSFRLWAGL